MKIFLYSILLFFFLFSCSVPRTIVKEDVMYITKQYCGILLSDQQVKSDYFKGTTYIVTDRTSFHVKGYYTFPDSVRCYFQLKKSLYGSGTVIWMCYFTYEGTDKLYYILQDPILGKIY